MPKIDEERSTAKGILTRVVNLKKLFKRIKHVPEEWIDLEILSETPSIEPVYCDNYEELREAWKSAMEWTEGLDGAFAVMLASIISTNSLGDQLWMKIIGPASCGKSTLCEALSVNKKYIVPKSTIRGFHSGFGDGKEDNSLISILGGKTLIIKDGDTLLQAPNLHQILAEARDIYDTVSRTSYRNKASRSYEGVRMTFLLAGTQSLREIDQSQLGARFLDYVIMEGIDKEMEQKVLMHVARKAEKSLSYLASEEPAKQQEPEMTRVMELTGGYVEYLRSNSLSLLQNVKMNDTSMKKCVNFGLFVAYMRARPRQGQEDEAEREFAARLSSQMIRLTKCVAAVYNKSNVDRDVILVTKKVALDTSRGKTLDITEYLFKNPKGCESKSISMATGININTTRALLRFLKKIEVVEHVPKEVSKQKTKWRLTQTIRTLYRTVHR